MQKHVILNYPDGDTHICDTIGKAVEALDELGLCMNWGVLSQLNGFGCLMYQGWTYESSHERFVRLEFDPGDFASQLKSLLLNIFKPFIDAENNIHRSLILVNEAMVKGHKVFYVNIFLVFKGDKYREIYDVLDGVDDTHRDIKSTFFVLD